MKKGMKEKRGEHVKNVKRLADKKENANFAIADMQVFQLYAV